MQRQHCANDNHGRAVVTVRFCPTCGEVVNERISSQGCRQEKHASMRRVRYAFCVDCGVRVGLAR
jgi:hypothetical protein